MPKIQLPITNGFYKSRSLPISSQNCVNLYPVIKNTPALVQQSLRGTPGVEWILTNAITGEAYDGGPVVGGGGGPDGTETQGGVDGGGGGDNPDAGGIDIGDVPGLPDAEVDPPPEPVERCKQIDAWAESVESANGPFSLNANWPGPGELPNIITSVSEGSPVVGWEYRDIGLGSVGVGRVTNEPYSCVGRVAAAATGTNIGWFMAEPSSLPLSGSAALIGWPALTSSAPACVIFRILAVDTFGITRGWASFSVDSGDELPPTFTSPMTRGRASIEIDSEGNEYSAYGSYQTEPDPESSSNYHIPKLFQIDWAIGSGTNVGGLQWSYPLTVNFYVDGVLLLSRSETVFTYFGPLDPSESKIALFGGGSGLVFYETISTDQNLNAQEQADLLAAFQNYINLP